MADDIKQRIVLEGDGEILRILRQIGEAGKTAFDSVRTAAQNVTGSTQQAQVNLVAVEEAARRVGVSLRNMGEAAVEVGRGFTALGKVAAATSAALFVVTRGFAQNADNAEEAAAAIGITTEEYGKLAFALSRNGGSIQQAGVALNRLTDRIKAARDGNTEATETFRKLQVQLRNSDGSFKNTAQVLTGLADRFSEMPDGVEKTALAIELFGQRAGPRLIPLLNQGRAGIEQLSQRAQELGIVFDAEGAKIGAAFEDSLQDLLESINGIRNSIGRALAPVFTDVFNALTEVFIAIRPDIEAIVVLVRDGLVGAFNVLRTVVVPVLQAVYAAIQLVADGFNQIFGTNITARQIIIVAGFVAMSAAALSFATSILAIIPGATRLLSILTGIPQVVSLITGSFRLLASTITLVVNAVRLLALVFGGWQLALIAVGVAIGFLLVEYLNSERFAQALAGIQQAFTDAWSSIVQTVQTALLTIQTTFQSAILFIDQMWTSFTQTLSGVWTQLAEGANIVWEMIIEQVTLVIETLVELWTGFQEFFTTLWTSFGELFTSAWQAIVDGANFAVQSVLQLWTDFRDTLISYFTEIRDFINQVWESVKDKIAGLFGAGRSQGGGRSQSFATGGQVRGAGGPTQDNIPIWASAGEYVIKVAAVKKYGADFFKALNSMRLDLDGFSQGGLVGSFGDLNFAPELKFADGGQVPARTNGNTLNLTIGGEKFEGLMADDETMDKLTRFASHQKIRSAGRKPGWSQ